ncbi:uroporphyrinogen-III synthase [Alteriqipengyuania lutimaris]|uniref:Uroporphyrinogen-III synthase n=1 Tax=Alteriqipengyuania lutimaris TaxID=1538146 RepID=A0A395LJG9_9SPHN|nr:uroporphyrinogen-III synthase [Alteriqipengyuania lutimaris]MBB3033917.1 uroporphyrinogen-III synthase [Alteriqipengyuania lutimaris]RDS77123.1 uroporphyrinogen-III synthase [Alteriqipengyuania lutimaris]
MSMPVFVLRPEPGLSATMRRGIAMGLAMEAMPLSHAEPLDWDMPGGRFDGILLGSANGLRHAGEAIARHTDLPVYAVGQATAEKARALGFTVAQVGSGGLQPLVDSLPDDRAFTFLRLAGAEHVPLDLPPHVSITTRTTYRIVHASLENAQVARLAQGGVVLLHSGAVAAHFARECDRAGLDRASLALAALAPRIARSVSDGWKSVELAASPDDGALLSLVKDMRH